jgi:hypothetical protein
MGSIPITRSIFLLVSRGMREKLGIKEAVKEMFWV